MFRTVVTPKNTSLQMSIPNAYIGKEIEILLYSKEEISEEKTKLKATTMEDFKGILTLKEAEQLQQYVKKLREEWDKNIKGLKMINLHTL